MLKLYLFHTQNGFNLSESFPLAVLYNFKDFLISQPHAHVGYELSERKKGLTISEEAILRNIKYSD